MAPAGRRAGSRAKRVEIPPVLLEGDRPAPPPVSGPGQKFALGPTPPAQVLETENGDLPESYGTRSLFLTARDPHWLYAHWDLAREQQLKANARSAEGHLVLRIYTGGFEERLSCEIHVHPESRHWFVHVGRGGTQYTAELGYYRRGGKWTRLAASAATFTPPDEVSTAAPVEFATIPADVPLPRLLSLVKATVSENFPLARAMEELRRAGHPGLPSAVSATLRNWTAEQEQALARVIGVDSLRRVWLGSLEITELIRRRLAREISSPAASQFGVSSISSLSSPFGGAAQPRGFWFNVNAELVIYGATEPTARVTLDGREIQLRPDGSFSFRFALPDGHYELPAVAVSADGTEARAADLKFSRATRYTGDVGAHPQDPALKPPSADNL
ncbi:MAG: DUF4912 domain-containing protein [Verrucomicrobiota bacterium]|nr:DUF4912 domain-containing protein [Verrucomicrobiota bacterium]